MNEYRQIILESWKRSEKYNIDKINGEVDVIAENKLKKVLEQNSELIKIAEPYVNNLYSFVKQSSYRVILTDRKGCVIKLLGDEVWVEEHIKPKLGLIYSERSIGTNSIGTAIINDTPLQVVGEEHYSSKYKTITGSCAPIHDSEGNIIGTLNMGAPKEKVHPHTLGMVIAAADAIEREMKIKKMYDEKIFLLNQQVAIFNMISDGVIVINKEENIVQVNKTAENLLGFKNVLGRNIYNYIECEFKFSGLMKKNKIISNEEVNIKRNNHNQSVVISTTNIKEQNGQIEAVIVTIKEMKQVKKLINKMINSSAKFSFDLIIGKSQSINDAKRLGEMAAKSSSNVLILGESGTGKELMAQAIHNRSNRKNGPFIAINCGALPRNLIESELFGYEGGAFTGSKKQGNPGKFELADGGTIFLDEIGDMPLEVQVNLLRVLQNKEVIRIGASKPKKVDVRIIAATNKNLIDEIKNKNFREDLYYRLNVLNIKNPPLRERLEDIPLLVDYFVNSLNEKMGMYIHNVDENVYNILKKYDWPGNIRELENVIERAFNVTDSHSIKVTDLPKNILELSDRNKVYEKSNLLEAKEYETIVLALSDNKGNIKNTASQLGVARSSLYRKLGQYNIDYKEYRKHK